MPNESAVTVTDWGQATLASLSAALALFFAAIPKVIGFVVVLAIGWFVASMLERGLAAVLRAVRFNDLAERAGLATFVRRTGVQTDAAGFLGHVGKWFVRLIALVVAFDALGLPAVSDVLRQLLLWLPNLAVALVVLVIGGLVAHAAHDLVAGASAQAGLERPELLARIASIAVWVFAIVVAVNQIGIAATLVNALFMAVVGAAALALGLAFGLGGRDVAAQVTRRMYERSREAAPRIGEAGDALARRTAEEASDAAAALRGAAGAAAGRRTPPPSRGVSQAGSMPGGMMPQPSMQNPPDLEDPDRPQRS